MLNRKVASVLGGLLAAWPAFAYESSYNLPVGVTPISREMYGAAHDDLLGLRGDRGGRCSAR